MKKHLKATLLILLVAVIALTVLVACDEFKNLKTPTGLHFDGDTLNWNEVKNAETYEVAIYHAGDSRVLRTETVSSTSYTVYLDEQGEYEMCVRAVGDLEKYGYSDFSAKIAYTRGNNISKPVTTLNADSKTIQWNAVEGAGAYFISVLKPDGEVAYEGYITETSFSLEREELADPNAYSIRVKSVIAADVNNQLDSAFSDAKVYYKTAQLSAVNFSSLTSSRLYWNNSPNRSSYLIKATNQNDSSVVFEATVESTSSAPSMLIANLKIDQIGTYNLTVQAIGDGEIYLDSAVSEVSEDYVLHKIANYEVTDDKVSYKLGDKNSSAVLTWKVTEEEMKSFTSMVVKFDSVYSSITVSDVTFQIYKDEEGNIVVDGENKDIQYTKEEGTGMYVFTYDLFKSFYTYNDNGMEFNADGSSSVLNNNHMGHYYTVSIQGRNNNTKYLDTDAVKVEGVEILTATRPKYTGAVGEEYTITKPSDLFYMHIEPNANYRLASNETEGASTTGLAIDMSGYYWRAVSEFSGNFYGMDSVITNLTLQYGSSGISTFIENIANGASINNLFLMNIKIATPSKEETEANFYITKIAGVAITNNGMIDTAYVSGSISSTSADIAGLVYTNKGTIYNAVNDITITARNYAAGIAVYNEEGAQISRSNSRTNISATGAVIEDFEGAKTAYVGGLVAINNGTIEDSFSVGNISATTAEIDNDTEVVAGGLVAINNGAIESSYAGRYFTRNAADINQVSANIDKGIAGGLVGINGGTITDSYATSKATAVQSVGGFVGENTGTITSCYSTGGTDKRVARNTGSFAGLSSGEINNAFYHDPSSERSDSYVSNYVSADNLLSNEAIEILNSRVFVNATVDGSTIFRNLIISGINADAYTIELNYSADYSSKINVYFSAKTEDGLFINTKITDANDGVDSCWVGDYDGNYTLRKIVYNSRIVLIRVQII